MGKVITNDQGHIIEAIKKKNYAYVWEQVKFIGIKDEENVNFRYFVFSEAVRKFDPYINNNFIKFYKDALVFKNFSVTREGILANERTKNVRKMREQKNSPNDDAPKLIENLDNWEF